MRIYRQNKDISYTEKYLFPFSFSPKRCDLHSELNSEYIFLNSKGVIHAALALYNKIQRQDYKRQVKLKIFDTIYYLSLENYSIGILKHLKDFIRTASVLPFLSHFVMIISDVPYSQWMGEHWIKGSQGMNKTFRKFSRSFEYMKICSFWMYEKINLILQDISWILQWWTQNWNVG